MVQTASQCLSICGQPKTLHFLVIKKCVHFDSVTINPFWLIFVSIW